MLLPFICDDLMFVFKFIKFIIIIVKINSEGHNLKTILVKSFTPLSLTPSKHFLGFSLLFHLCIWTIIRLPLLYLSLSESKCSVSIEAPHNFRLFLVR